jgi:serine/threonine protein kinase/Tol biopolymer transport system component/6-phosphogluconolactonase (cycloisomerase 2 family)
VDEESIFADAVHMTSLAERRAYLDCVCGDDDGLRSSVEELLQADQQADSPLDAPPMGFLPLITVGGIAADADELTDVVQSLLAPSDKPGCLGTMGQYEVIGVVGHGGMGIALRSYDTKLNRVVAIKVIAPELVRDSTAVERFLREAQAAAAVSHDHVVTIHGVHEDNEPPFIVMEFIDGPSLQNKISEQGALVLKELLRIGNQLAAGLAAAHKQGLVHRDVKPSNILLENGVERVKITDFGLARRTDDKSLTHVGGIAGTPQFMSPEQAQGQPVDARTDLFSLGSVLYTMCTGRSPFPADSAVAVLRRVCDDQPEPIRDINANIPGWLCDVIAKLLEKEPNDRFGSAEEVADLLEQYLAHIQAPKTAAHPPRIEPPSQQPSNIPIAPWQLWSLVGAIAALLLIMAASYLKTSWSRPDPQVSDPTGPRTDGAKIERSPSDIDVQPFLPPPSITRVESEADVALLAGVERWIEVPDANGDGMTIVEGSKIVVTQIGEDGSSPLQFVDVESGDPLAAIDFDPPPGVAVDQPHIHKGIVSSADGRYLFLNNYYSHHVTRIDLHDDNAVTHLPVGGIEEHNYAWPAAIGITSDQKRLVVTLGQDGKSEDLKNDFVSVVDVEDGRFRVLGTVRLEDEPVAPNIGFSSNSQSAYFVTRQRKSAHGVLYEISLSDPYETTRRLSFEDAELGGLVIADQHRRIYVSDAAHHKIWMVDLGSFEIVDEVSLFGHAPGAMTINQDHQLLAALCPGSRVLFCIDTNTGQIVGGASSLAQKPHSVTFAGETLLVSHHRAAQRISAISVDHLLNRVVFASNREGGSYQLYVTGMDGKKLGRLTKGPFTHRSPRWSPDGRHVACLSDRTGPLKVCVINRDGSDATSFEQTDPVLGSEGEASIAWSPSPRGLAHFAEPLEQTVPVPLSTDGSKIAFIGDDHRAIRVVDTMTGDVRTLLSGAVVERYSHHNGLCWSRADDKILFNSQSPIDGRTQDLFRLNPNSGEVTQLTFEGDRRSYFVSPASSPNGDRIAVIHQQSADPLPRNIFLMESSSSALRQLTTDNLSRHQNPRWFPDGKRILYAAGDDSHHQLYMIDLEDGLARQLAPGDGDHIEPDIWGVSNPQSSTPREVE